LKKIFLYLEKGGDIYSPISKEIVSLLSRVVNTVFKVKEEDVDQVAYFIKAMLVLYGKMGEGGDMFFQFTSSLVKHRRFTLLIGPPLFE